MGKCSDLCPWFLFAFGWMFTVIGLSLSSPHRMPVLFWMAAFAPITVPACAYGLSIFVVLFIETLEKIEVRRHTSTNQTAATVAAVVEEHTLQPEMREPPITNRAHSFDITSLPMYLYNKEAVEGGLVCPICKELFGKSDVMVQLPLCIHCYHKDCIEVWLRRNLTCPVCRCRVDMEIPRDIALSITS